ncbi:MAG: DHH family phosphoesterase, partial [Erysipelotrichaceae bacterium]|nr:DHH family phosphoesterase [Erysipelotrichaceae bacterium]
SRSHLLNYKKKQFIFLEHIEFSKSIDYLEEGEILEIIDHHRIGDVQTTYPVRFRNELVGSTCTIISLLYREHQITPTPTIAGLLCCAIISDTMNFNSPTTTAVDKEAAKRLAEIANLDLDAMAKEMFQAVATLKGRSLSEILYNDFKEYHIGDKRIAIGQINLADVEEMEAIKEEFLSYLNKINEIHKFDLLMMCFTNVEGKGSNLIFVGQLHWLVDEVFKDVILDEHYFVDGIISRKKQIIPFLSKGLHS